MDDPNFEGSKLEKALDVTTPVLAAIPYIGGAVSSIVSRNVTGRRFKRIEDLLTDISPRLAYIEAEASEDSKAYVKTEDFEELLLETLDRVGKEHNDERRKLYGLFLLGSINSPDRPYDEQLGFLKTIDELQWAHLIVLRAYAQAPDPKRSRMPGGSISQTLERRIGDELGTSSPPIAVLVEQLHKLGLISDNSIGGLMTGAGAEDLASRITPYGARLMAFITAVGT